MIDLRRTFFSDTPRRAMIAASATDEAWTDTVSQANGPYFLAAEAAVQRLPQVEEYRLNLVHLP